MQVTKRQEERERNRERERDRKKERERERDVARANGEVGAGAEGWHRRQTGLTWRMGGDGEGKKRRKKKDKRKENSVSSMFRIRLPSLPGLVEEDVSRLRVLGDV